jgi:MerR family transcriptional regulator, light-induced transcriptional regulator
MLAMLTEAPLSISDVEQQLGLSKDTLRIWERRYGFPVPERDAKGNRVYPRTQVERLKRIKRMVDSGYRPSRVIASELALARSPSPAAKTKVAAPARHDWLLAPIRRA